MVFEGWKSRGYLIIHHGNSSSYFCDFTVIIFIFHSMLGSKMLLLNKANKKAYTRWFWKLVHRSCFPSSREVCLSPQHHIYHPDFFISSAHPLHDKHNNFTNSILGRQMLAVEILQTNARLYQGTEQRCCFITPICSYYSFSIRDIGIFLSIYSQII